jgi:two-component system alkaline phosphatase synthesis response regulator PhoP
MPKKILIVEDETILKEMYEQKFRQSGFEVYTADDGEEGFFLALKVKPDLILLDILLPKENGLAWLKRVRDNAQLAGIKVVAFSNFDDPNSKNTAAELGVVDYLIKTNFTPAEVIERVKNYLN